MVQIILLADAMTFGFCFSANKYCMHLNLDPGHSRWQVIFQLSYTNLNVNSDPVIIFQSSKKISFLLHKYGPGPGKFKMVVCLILD